MAKANAPSWDDLSKVQTSQDTDDDGEPLIKLDPGEDVVAEVRFIEEEVGQHGNTMLHLTTTDGDPVRMWSNTTIDRALDAAEVTAGDVIGIRKHEESYTFETEDGDEREAYDFDVGVLEK